MDNNIGGLGGNIGINGINGYNGTGATGGNGGNAGASIFIVANTINNFTININKKYKSK